MSSKKWGYVRVSTEAQEQARQLDLLMGKYGIPESDIFVDKTSGKNLERKQFQQLQRVLRTGDTVVVESLSRLSRSTKDLIELLDDWGSKGISCKSDKEDLDFSTSTGKLLLSVIAALAEFERSLIRERVMEGLASARARGRVGGRPATPKSKVEKAIKLYRSNAYSIREITEITGVSGSVLHRSLRKEKAALSSSDVIESN